MAWKMGEPNDRALAVAGIAAALLGSAYILWRSVLQPIAEVDFRFFWLAGRLWADGLDPYGPAFERLGAQLLPPGNVVHYWFYPPQWWPVCRALATMDLAHATAAWRLANGAMVMGGSIILVLAIAGGSLDRRWGLAGLTCGFAALIEPTANLLAFGQSAGFLYLALCLVTAGAARRCWWPVAAGLLLSTFKPQVGVLLFLAFVFVPFYWRAILAALVAAFLLALPQFLAFGAILTVGEFLANLHAWGSLPSNTLLTSSGPLHLLARVATLPVGPHAGMLPALVATLAAGWLIRTRPDEPLPPLLLLAATITGLVPLHIYDMTMLVVPLMLVIAIDGGITILVMLVSLMAVRPGKIEAALGVPTYSSGVSGGLISLSIAGLTLFGIAIRAVVASPRRD